MEVGKKGVIQVFSGVFLFSMISSMSYAWDGDVGERDTVIHRYLVITETLQEIESQMLEDKERKLEVGSWKLDESREQERVFQIGDYLIREGDVLRIVAWKELDISVMVRPDGKISVPVVGEVIATNKTPNQLSKELSLKGKTNVVVILEKMAEMQDTGDEMQDEEEGVEVIILGEVDKPGVYDAWTVYELIAKAGGFTKAADKGSIFLYRDEREFGVWNLEAGYWMLEDDEVLLEDGDLVLVKESTREKITDTVSFLSKAVKFFGLVYLLMQ